MFKKWLNGFKIEKTQNDCNQKINNMIFLQALRDLYMNGKQNNQLHIVKFIIERLAVVLPVGTYNLTSCVVLKVEQVVKHHKKCKIIEKCC